MDFYSLSSLFVLLCCEERIVVACLPFSWRQFYEEGEQRNKQADRDGNYSDQESDFTR